MKKLLVVAFLLAGFFAQAQSASFTDALSEARAQHKLVLLRFSGSDWCIPCIRMEKEIFGDSAFQHFSHEGFVSVQADFPRQKKHQLPQAQQEANGALAARYDPQGSFPMLLVLDADGKVLRHWDGGVKDRAAFTAQLEALRRGAQQP